MLIPKVQNRYCIFCNRHTSHKVDHAKRKPRRETAKGQKRFRRKLAGYGSFPKENPKGREKPIRKLDLRYLCSECNKKHSLGKGFRVRKVEWKK